MKTVPCRKSEKSFCVVKYCKAPDVMLLNGVILGEMGTAHMPLVGSRGNVMTIPTFIMTCTFYLEKMVMQVFLWI